MKTTMKTTIKKILKIVVPLAIAGLLAILGMCNPEMRATVEGLINNVDKKAVENVLQDF